MDGAACCLSPDGVRPECGAAAGAGRCGAGKRRLGPLVAPSCSGKPPPSGPVGHHRFLWSTNIHTHSCAQMGVHTDTHTHRHAWAHTRTHECGHTDTDTRGHTDIRACTHTQECTQQHADTGTRWSEGAGQARGASAQRLCPCSRSSDAGSAAPVPPEGRADRRKVPENLRL